MGWKRMIFSETTYLRPRCSLSPEASDSINKTSRSGWWVQTKNTLRSYYMACLPSVDTWQVCAHSFTCTSWNKRGIKEGWVLALCDVEQSQSLFWASVISSFSIPIWYDPTSIRSMLSGFSATPGPPRISVLLKAVFSCLLTQRIHDDCGCHRNDSSIIKVAAWDHKYSKES